MNEKIKVLTGPELSTVRESMKYLDLPNSVKKKVHDAITLYYVNNVKGLEIK